MSRHLEHYYSVAEYEEDINIFMKRQEEDRFRLHFSAPQLRFREELLMNLITVVNRLRLTERSLHLAVYFLDTYMDCHDIYIKRLELVSFACLSVAAKYEENDEKTAKLAELMQLMKDPPRKGLFMKMEFVILKFMQWKFIPTAVHFAEYYVQYAVSHDDLNHMYTSGDELMLAVRQYTKMFLRLALLDKRLMNEPRSLIGAACVAAAREKLCLFPIWTNRMFQVSGYRYYHVCPYTKLLIVNGQNGSFADEQERTIYYRCPCCCCYCCTSTSRYSRTTVSSYMPLSSAIPSLLPSLVAYAAGDAPREYVYVNDNFIAVKLSSRKD